MTRPRIVVLGCGSIGRRHAANLLELGCRVSAYDPDPNRRDWVCRKLGAEPLSCAERGLDSRPDAAWICAPPHRHAPLALMALERRVPCFLEKPLAESLAAGRLIVKAAAKARVPTAVGYQMRFHPTLRWIKARLQEGRWGKLMFLRAQLGQYLPDWRPWQDYRSSYSGKRGQGGGVLLDSSHELDLARWFAGEVRSAYCLAKRLSRLKVDVEDTAALVLEHRSGAVSEVHLDMVSRGPRRSIELACAEATVVWDNPTATLSVYSAKSRRWSAMSRPFVPNSIYMAETRSFLASLRHPDREGTVPAAEGLLTLAVVEASSRSARSGRKEPVRP